MRTARLSSHPEIVQAALCLPRRPPAPRRAQLQPHTAFSRWRFAAPLAALPSSSQGGDASTDRPRPSLLPAGKRQARVELPALFIQVSAAAAAAAVEDLSATVAGGATAVVLIETPGGGAGQLYEAAIAVKEALRGRAALLIADRTDIADAAGADGVVLSPSGLPTVVARGMLHNATALVGRAADSGAAAAAAAADGASFVVVQPQNAGATAAAATAAAAPVTAEDIEAALQQRSGSSVPVLAALGPGASLNAVAGLVAAGVDGVCLELTDLCAMEAGVPAGEAAAKLLRILQSSSSSCSSAASSSGDFVAGAVPPVAQLAQLLSSRREEVVAAEKQSLGALLSFLETACPAMEEVSLLRDSLSQLDELFLLVVVGEFNSGKTAVVNALLGRRVLAEGILPTTNEISVLKWADPNEPDKGERAEQDADGLFVRYVSSELLREVNVVDTPGTNVILDRQQRLTEEFVPRSDLVLFVMSADRPFTDSEVRFLRYIRQWGKKVVFVVNKVDLLASESEVAEVVAFVADNAARLLGVKGAKVVPVSAKLATEAKIACRVAEGDDSVQPLTLAEQACLVDDPRWDASRFEGLESFIRDFLLGGSAGGSGESVRLKLRTPLFVAEALVGAARTAIAAERDTARADAASVALVRSQLAGFRGEMTKEGRVQREEARERVLAVSKQASAVVDATLTLSNWSALSGYVLGSSGRGVLPPVAALFRQEVPKDSAAGLAAVVREHSAWVASNCQRQADNYRGFAAERLAALGSSFEDLRGVEAEELQRDPEARRRWRQLRAAVAGGGEEGASTPSYATSSSEALAVATSFDPSATEAMLETDVREAVLSTATTAAGAGTVGLLLTTVLPTTLEDLLAVALGSAIAYASVLSLPLRRADAKKKAETAAVEVADAVQRRMEEELEAALRRCEAEVLSFVEPLEELTQAAVATAEAAMEELQQRADEVEALQRRVADIE